MKKIISWENSWRKIFVLEVIVVLALVVLALLKKINIFGMSFLSAILVIIAITVLALSITGSIMAYTKKTRLGEGTYKLFRIDDDKKKYFGISTILMIAAAMNLLLSNKDIRIFSMFIVSISMALFFFVISKIEMAMNEKGVFWNGNLFIWSKISEFEMFEEEGIILFKIVGSVFVNEIKCKYNIENSSEIREYIENKINKKIKF